MDTMQLSSEIRTQTGKGSARKLRSTGKLPAILYGPETDPIMLTLDFKELKKALEGKSAESVLLNLRIDSDKIGQSKTVMIKEIQRDPVKRDYLHVDLFEISLKKEVEVDIPLHLVGTPIGVTEGGMLQHVRREVKVSCMPDDLVDKIDVDVSGLDIGQSLHIGDISFPSGLKSLEDVDVTIVTVVAPAKVAEEEEVEEVEEIEGEEPKSEEES